MTTNGGVKRKAKTGPPGKIRSSLMIPFTVVLGLFLKGERIISHWGME